MQAYSLGNRDGSTCSLPTHQEPPRTTKKYQELPAIIKNHQELPRTTEKHRWKAGVTQPFIQIVIMVGECEGRVLT